MWEFAIDGTVMEIRRFEGSFRSATGWNKTVMILK
jgi:hypothetical protein